MIENQHTKDTTGQKYVYADKLGVLKPQQLITICSEHLTKYGNDIFYRECLGELYYRYQMKERERGNQENAFNTVSATFPCIYGIDPIGTYQGASAADGHKYACGLRDIEGPPIVYSFGSHKQQDFEEGFLNYRSDAKIFTFEIDPDGLLPLEERLKQVQFFTIGLGYNGTIGRFKTTPIMSLHDIMKKLGHSYIDVMKIDIEGGEFEFIKREGNVLRRIGQVLIEVHNGNPKSEHSWDPPNKYIKFISAFEHHGLRLYFKEINKYWIRGCELSFMQAEWSSWNKGKTEFRALSHLDTVVAEPDGRRLMMVTEIGALDKIKHFINISDHLMIIVVLLFMLYIFSRSLYRIFIKKSFTTDKENIVLVSTH